MRRNTKISRRDFLKLASLVPATYFARPLLNAIDEFQKPDVPNVIVFVFDAWSAHNLSLYGYPRQTMPNLTRFAERATVYHNHLSAGTFTSSGTASLLTGLYPWTHRALQLYSGIIQEHENHQLFNIFKPTHTTVGYSQNKASDQFLFQAYRDLDTHIPVGAFDIQNRFVYSLPIFEKDGRVGFSSFDGNIFQLGSGFDASLFFGPLFRSGTLYDRSLLDKIYRDKYPRGMPDSDEFFLLENVVDGAIKTLGDIEQPSFVYMHFYPPHEPYRPSVDFFKAFDEDSYIPEIQEPHPLSGGENKKGTLRASQQFYDEFMLSWDNEFGRVYDYLEKSGLLDNSYVIITSDHGEIHNRGVIGHMTPLIFQPLAQVPLIISTPGQAKRKDVYAATSSVDVLPTLAQITGNRLPSWSEGVPLPGFGRAEDPLRSVYVMDAKENSSFAPLKKYSMSITKNSYRLTHYQYPQYQGFEFYNLDEDPDETYDLYPSLPSEAIAMRDELLDKLAEVNQPFLQK